MKKFKIQNSPREIQGISGPAGLSPRNCEAISRETKSSESFQDSRGRFKIQDSKSPHLQSSIFNFQFSIKNNGLTLLEIAVGLAILSIALVSLAHLFPIGLHSSRRSGNFSEVGILQQRVVDNIRRAVSIYDTGDEGQSTANPGCSDEDGIGYFELVSTDTGPFGDDESTLDITQTPTFIYTYSTPNNMKAHIRSETDASLGDAKLIQKVYVAIYWKEGENIRADTLVTFITNPYYEKYK